jgi:hypothetical protein
MKSKTHASKIRFDLSGYYFTGLILLVLLGFWPSYFSKLFTGTNKFSFYFHFHAVMMFLWIVLLITQPILIRKQKFALHRLMGKLSYFLMPLLFLSLILLTHFRIQEHVLIIGQEKFYGPHLVIPFKDLLILGTSYLIAIRYRHNMNIHARAMISTGIVFIEPALFRLLHHTMLKNGQIAFLVTIGLLYALIITLIFIERKQPRGKWVFPMILGLYIIAHSIIIFEIQFKPWELFARWFANLPLT